MSPALLQALHVLQMPLLECVEWIEKQIEENPLLELMPKERSQCLPYEECYSPLTLLEKLMGQARCHFFDEQDIVLAEWLIGHLNERGFLDIPLEELPSIATSHKWREILEEVQKFDPPGVAARCIQEAFLLQLKRKGRVHSLAYKIVRDHYEDLLHFRMAKLSRVLGLPGTLIEETVQMEIAMLEPCPARSYLRHVSCPILPDLIFREDQGSWVVEINRDPFPQWQLHPIHNELDKKELLACRPFLQRAGWLQKVVQRRIELLYRLGTLLLKEQKDFFKNGVLKPLSVKSTAKFLNIHPSTLARAIGHKYASVEGSLVALSQFFLRKVGENKTSNSLKQSILRLVEEEDKNAPLSDEALSLALQEQGFSCARRTIAKYRTGLRIQSKMKRKNFKDRE